VRSFRVGVRSGEFGSLLRTVAFALAAVSATACKAPPPVVDLPAVAVVAPVNFDVDSPAQLDEGIVVVQQLVAVYLEKKGVRAQRVDLPTFRKAWFVDAGEEKPPAPDQPEYGTRMAVVLRALASESEDAVLVIPHLIYRPAEMVGTQAKWDGVSRKILVEGKGDRLDSFFSGPTTALSLRLRVFDPNGDEVHQQYAGHDVHWYKLCNVGNAPGEYRYNCSREEFKTGKMLFEDRTLLARTIMNAFVPYIPRQ